MREQKEGGLKCWNVSNGLRGSSTRTEIGAALIALQPPIRVNIGVDNAAVVGRTNAMIDHHKRRKRTVLVNKNGALRFGGEISPLHANTPLKQKRWNLVKDGDMWETMNNAIQAKGCDYIRLTKVKGHATSQMVEDGKVKPEDKNGNDEADDSADRGAEKLQPGLAGIAGYYARKHHAYKDMMKEVHKFIIDVKRSDKEKREKKKLEANPMKDKEKDKVLVARNWH